MPTEDRFIVFNYDEVYTALRIRKITENSGELPTNAEITNVEFPETDPEANEIIISLKTENGSNEDITITREFFALALVFYCQGHSIPIPRAGQKSIVRKDDKIVLHITIK